DLRIGRHCLKHTAPRRRSPAAKDPLPGPCAKDRFGTTEVQHSPGHRIDGYRNTALCPPHCTRSPVEDVSATGLITRQRGT
ncbi:hypothetical protein M9458_029651, partial [Cirrhinus mrigala]